MSSANYLFKYLSQQVGMSYQEIRQQRVELRMIMERCRFFLVRKSVHQEGQGRSQPYRLEDFERLRLAQIVQIPNLEREIEEFMAKNSLELEFFSEETHGEKVSS